MTINIVNWVRQCCPAEEWGIWITQRWGARRKKEGGRREGGGDGPCQKGVCGEMAVSLGFYTLRSNVSVLRLQVVLHVATSFTTDWAGFTTLAQRLQVRVRTSAWFWADTSTTCSTLDLGCPLHRFFKVLLTYPFFKFIRDIITYMYVQWLTVLMLILIFSDPLHPSRVHSRVRAFMHSESFRVRVRVLVHVVCVFNVWMRVTLYVICTCILILILMIKIYPPWLLRVKYMYMESKVKWWVV